jgi:hypothetical protein
MNRCNKGDTDRHSYSTDNCEGNYCTYMMTPTLKHELSEWHIIICPPLHPVLVTHLMTNRTITFGEPRSKRSLDIERKLLLHWRSLWPWPSDTKTIGSWRRLYKSWTPSLRSLVEPRSKRFQDIMPKWLGLRTNRHKQDVLTPLKGGA